MSEFQGTERYEVRRRLGEGAMGVVYEVYDRTHDVTRALKTLSHVDALGIYHLKQEFRALSDLRHPNLVALHQMAYEDGHWFFTMDLVDGVDFLSYVVPTPRVNALEQTLDEDATATPASARLAYDTSRLLAAAGGLVEGVSALHQSGKLHRDLKPSNVLVTEPGQVVVLDFGLVQEAGTSPSLSGPIVGTPGYMPPEQAAGGHTTTASDWYALGAILYRCVHGSLPFQGTVREVLLAKQTLDPPRLAELEPDAPVELAKLIDGLLSRDPSQRPGESEIREVLALPARARRRASTTLLGRRHELAVLEDALRQVELGNGQAIGVEGAHGVGKTALLRAFSADLKALQPPVCVLYGRCYPRESVPFNAFDGLVDQLTAYLERLSAEEAQLRLPRRARSLVELFPVLDRVLSVQQFPAPAPAANDRARRLEAFNAFAEVLARIADRGLLVMQLDDLQWADQDSVRLLQHLLQSADGPTCLWLLSYRAESPAPSSSFSKRLYGEVDPQRSVQRMRLSPLSPETSEALCKQWLGAAEAASPASSGQLTSTARTIAQQCAGNPLGMRLLCAAWPTMGAPPQQALSMEALVDRQMAEWPEHCRALVRLLAIAQAPLELTMARLTIAATPEQLHASAQTLQAAEWIEIDEHAPSLDSSLRLQHEVLGELVLERINRAEQRHLHVALARSLQQNLQKSATDPASTPEMRVARSATLLNQAAAHFAQGGHATEALRCLRQSLELDQQGLSFDRAADMHHRLLQLTSSAKERIQLFESLAEVEVTRGELGAAADCLLQASQLASGEEARTLRERASRMRLADSDLERLFQPSQPQPSSYLFEGISRDDVREVLGSSRLLEAETGEWISSGDSEPCVIVVMTGQVEVAHEQGNVSLDEGEVLGAVSFFRGVAQSTTLRASKNDTRVLIVTRKALDRLSESRPQLALQLMNNLAKILCEKLRIVGQRAFAR